MQEVELKPCPFCGGKASLKAKTKNIGEFVTWCECDKCHAKIDGYYADIKREDISIENIERCKIKTIEDWNRRV